MRNAIVIEGTFEKILSDSGMWAGGSPIPPTAISDAFDPDGSVSLSIKVRLALNGRTPLYSMLNEENRVRSVLSGVKIYVKLLGERGTLQQMKVNLGRQKQALTWIHIFLSPSGVLMQWSLVPHRGNLAWAISYG